MMSPMHKKVAAASSFFSEWALALRRSIGEPGSTSASSTSGKNAGSNPTPSEKATSTGAERTEMVQQLSGGSGSQSNETGSQENDLAEEEDPRGGGSTSPDPNVLVKTNHSLPPEQSNTTSNSALTPLSEEKEHPDIHPELTLAEIQQFIKKKSSAPTIGDLHEELDRKLEINTMFDFHSRMKLKSGKLRNRRSSVAVMAGGSLINNRSAERQFFESNYLNLHSTASAASQSQTVVHYLAISPPRIRITDDKGSVSPDMYGGRLGQNSSTASATSSSLQLKEENEAETEEPEDEATSGGTTSGEAISGDSKSCETKVMVDEEVIHIIGTGRKTVTQTTAASEAAVAMAKRRTSNSSTTSSSCSSSGSSGPPPLTRGSSINTDSRRSSNAGGNWSHRSR